jgi:hypothetical protein
MEWLRKVLVLVVLNVLTGAGVSVGETEVVNSI